MYYEVIAASNQLKNKDSLTYKCSEPLKVNQIVLVPLRNKIIPAVVVKKTKKPSFNTKEVLEKTQYTLPDHSLQWLKQVSDFYAGNINAFTSQLIPAGINKKRRVKIEKLSGQFKLTTLNTYQKKAVKEIESSKKACLLHGVTGSGKTRIYIELVKNINKTKGAIILVPEIGLTKQLLGEFASVLDNVFVFHSNLTNAEKHLTWQKIYQCKNPVVIGPRSALFSPVKNLGLIVIDEAHEKTYKQDTAPRYHAIHAAALLAKQTEAKLVLGSATPRIEDYFLAKKNHLQLVEISQNATGREYDKNLIIIDRKSKQQFSQSRIFSKKLINSIDKNLNEGKQSLIFHARRGTSTSVICADCGWIAQCPNCELPLTHHQDFQKLVCHICNHRSSIVTSCPDCKSSEVNYRGIGTKQIAEEAKKLFPESKIARFDGDNTKDLKLENRFLELKNGKIDIIVGTHGLVKGLDLPKLATAAIVDADSLLNIPDYNATENAFQTIHQLSGRVSRHFAGEVFIQTYNPTDKILQFSKEQNFADFYEYEISNREEAHYPPSVYMMKIIVERRTLQSSFTAANKIINGIRAEKVIVLGPAPPLRYRINNKYINHIILKSRSRNKLVEIAQKLPGNEKFDLDPIQLL